MINERRNSLKSLKASRKVFQLIIQRIRACNELEGSEEVKFTEHIKKKKLFTSAFMAATQDVCVH